MDGELNEPQFPNKGVMPRENVVWVRKKVTGFEL